MSMFMNALIVMKCFMLMSHVKKAIFGNWLQKEDGTYWYNVNGNFIELLYVHELQNLYFSLMGRELKK